MTEKELIAGLRRGDMAAYERAFHLYYPRFVYFADYIVKDQQTAKDLVQNVFLKVWRFRDRLKDDLSLVNYLYVLTKREVLNHLRGFKAIESLQDELAGHCEGVGGEHLEAQVDAALVREWIQTLPDKRRRVFELSRLRGMSNKEISRVLSISEKTVERHITLALRQLKEEFRNEK